MMIHKDHRKEGLQSEKFSKRKKKKNLILIVFFSFIILLFLLFVSFLSKLSFLQIDTVEISGTDARLSESIRASVLEDLSGRYLWLLSRSNILIYPKSDIEKSLVHISPVIKNVDVSRNGRKSILINVTEKSPYNIICTNLPDFTSHIVDDSCYFADKDGFVFKKVDRDSDSISKLYIQTGSTTILGSIPVEKSRYEALSSIYKKIQQSGIEVVGLLLGSANDELYIKNVYSNTDGPSLAVVYFNEKNNLEDMYTNLVSFWDHMKKDKIQHEFSEIKLQFPPNVYYTEVK